ncbi:MAG: AEC family transporter, partial [Planctomycetota bacterium]
MLPILNILGPILLMAGCGALLQRSFRLSLDTLVKLNLYLFVPAFLLHYLANSSISAGDVAWIIGLTTIVGVGLGLVVGGVARAFGAKRSTVSALFLATCVYNSGNYGLPLAELAYDEAGAATQTFVLFTQNLLTFTVGILVAGGGSMPIGKAIGKFFAMPIPYAIAVGIGLRLAGPDVLPTALEKSMAYLAGGLVPVALVTLGAQLADKPRWPRWKPVAAVCVARLVLGPLLMMGLLAVLPTGLTPVAADTLILTASVPVAINTLLLTMELGGDADLAADCVFWSTVLSAFTVAGWIA